MIDTKAIRSKILDLAIRGKLTDQLPEDGTAEELYQQIQEEKQTLVKSGKIKKEKPLPEITEDEMPFEIPENWKWVRFGDILRVLSGVSYEKSDVSTSGLRILRGGNIQEMKVVYDTSDVFLPLFYKEEEKTIHKGDIVIVASTGSEAVIGKPGYVTEDDNDTMVGAFLRICRPNSIELSQFIRILFMSEYYRQHIRQEAKGTNINNVKENHITHLLVPLPPLAEQKRIVEKIEQAFSVLDTIDELQAKYADNLTALKSKLIDLAIQGKLTEQRPEDGSAEELYQQIQEEKQALIKSGKIKKEKPLPEINPDEIPFEIPGSWKWVRLSSAFDVRDGTHDTPKYYDHGVPLVTSKNLSSGILGFEDVKLISCEDAIKINERSKVNRGDILFAMIGTIGNPVIVDTDVEFCIKNVALFKPLQGTKLNMEYLRFYLLMEQNELKRISVGGLQPFVSLKQFRNHPFPLPPLAEQKRIVDRLDKLLAVCD